ncbi:MAG: HTH domain-containing protein, partial [Peptococcaceae bacterium]|nr:HTH domain-containing protein [Peptococcaceae bacterium]
MAKKLEIENRRKQLLNELEKHPEGLSYTELEQLLNKKKRTIASDVEDLRKSGSDIVIKND